MNQIIKNLEVIEQDLNSLQAEYNAKLEAIHLEYGERLSATRKRYDSYALVAAELGLLKIPQIDNETKTEQETDVSESAHQKAEITGVRHPAQKYDLPIADAIEQALRDAGKPMPVEELRKMVAVLGVTPSSATFRSAIAKDKKNRFETVRRGVYKLRGATRNGFTSEPRSLFEANSLDEPQNGNSQKNHDFVLLEEVRKVIAELNGVEFTPRKAFEILQERFPGEINENRYKSVYSTVNNLRLKDELVKIRAGKDGEPAIYQAKNSVADFVS